jgi:hypothetical protein
MLATPLILAATLFALYLARTRMVLRIGARPAGRGLLSI